MTTFPVSSASEELLVRVRTNLAALRARIEKSAPDARSVRVVAVTKTFGLDVIDAAWSLGLVDVGENYLDELEGKVRDVDRPVRWHYLGALQSNKITRICQVADVVSGVSRMKELERIARSNRVPVLDVQVDFSHAVGRNGAHPDDVPALVARARSLGLEVRGLMTVAPTDRDAARTAFRGCRRLCDELGLEECSMGMSEDLELACELGSTEIRVGRALFGERVGPGTLA